MGRRLLEIVVYGKCCRIGAALTLDDLADTAIGDWKMPDFKAAVRTRGRRLADRPGLCADGGGAPD